MKTLHKDILNSFKKSKGRFISIMLLMALGSFALVGLKVTTPDMQKTAIKYYDKYNLMDISVIGEYGLDDNDVNLLNNTKDLKKIEFGYIVDTVIKDTTESIRFFSKSKEISNYEIVEGRLPENLGEIALSKFEGDKLNLKVGDIVDFKEKENINKKETLKNHRFKIVGFVNSTEIISTVDLGPSTSGSGNLNGYAVASNDLFNSDFYMIARMTFNDTFNVNPFSKEYREKIKVHKEEIDKVLQNSPDLRLNNVKKTINDEVSENQERITDGKININLNKFILDDSKKRIEDGSNELNDKKGTFFTEVFNAIAKIVNGNFSIDEAKTKISSSDDLINNAKTLLDDGSKTLSEKWNQLVESRSKLDEAKSTLDSSKVKLNEAKAVLDEKNAVIQSSKTKIDEAQGKIDENAKNLNAKQEELNKAKDTLAPKKAEYDSNLSAYNTGLNTYNSKKESLDSSLNTVNTGIDALNAKKSEFSEKIDELTKKRDELINSPQNSSNTNNSREVNELNNEIESLKNSKETFITSTYDVKMPELLVQKEAINNGLNSLSQVKTTLDASKTKLDTAKVAIDGALAKINEGKTQIDEGSKKIKEAQDALNLKKNELKSGQDLYNTNLDKYNAGLTEYNSGLNKYNENNDLYYSKLSQWKDAASLLDEKSTEYKDNLAKLNDAKSQLETKENELSDGKTKLIDTSFDSARKLIEAEFDLRENETKFIDKNGEFNYKSSLLLKDLNNSQSDLNEVVDYSNKLKYPRYSVYSRRDIPGSEGYKIYTTVTEIVASLSNIFPVFLYFVAALVTFTTMTRFVEEERINSGTLKALGYENRDITKKYTIYGATSAILGTILGIVLGHIALPYIVYFAYKKAFSLSKIELGFYLPISIIALILSLLSAVLPAYLVSKSELKDKCANLLKQKAPVSGSKILLEKIPFIWNKMSFTHKVTARNIFRYKKRMLMTIFGVAGATAMLFAGFSVRSSISDISKRQFKDIMHYDLILANKDSASDKELKEITNSLTSEKINKYTNVHFEEVTKIAGKNADEQEIKLIIPDSNDEFKEYMSIFSRKNKENIDLDKNGAVVSERLADVLNLKVGDSFTVKDSENKDVTIKISKISEMYLGHFIYLDKSLYSTYFNKDFNINGNLVKLKDGSIKNTNDVSASLMELNGVKGIVQNTNLNKQINTVTDALNIIMVTLILVSALLAVVILYNLTNINVSERIRELSTIKVLGFYNKEVTLYIYRETVFLTLIGILVGFIFGDMLHDFVLKVVPPEDVMFNPTLVSTDFIIPAVVLITITIILGKVVNNRLKNVNMLEALKALD